MAGGMDLGGGGKGKKKPLDTAINLVPFIDLMAVTISFLIMTAVWNQLRRLQVSQSGGPQPEQPQPETETIALTLLVTERGFSLAAGGAQVEIPKVRGAFVYCHASRADVLDDTCEEATLVGALKKVKGSVPLQRSITVQCEDGVRYSDLVKVIDVCNIKDPQNREQPLLFPDVSVSAVG